MGLVHYISHPNVVIDPDVPVRQWSISATGRARAEAMVTQPWAQTINRIISSAETKATDTAAVLSNHLGVEVEVRADTGETDRDATGFVPPAEHDALAERFFAHPEQSASGWERAIDAQTRIVDAVTDVLQPGDDTIAIVGHGGVGTLLYCHLAGLPIAASHDQPEGPAGHQGGHYWTFDPVEARVLHHWHPIDAEPASP